MSQEELIKSLKEEVALLKTEVTLLNERVTFFKGKADVESQIKSQLVHDITKLRTERGIIIKSGMDMYMGLHCSDIDFTKHQIVADAMEDFVQVVNNPLY